MGVAAFVGGKEMTYAGPRLLLCAGYASHTVQRRATALPPVCQRT
jgi:hypothetical protein